MKIGLDAKSCLNNIIIVEKSGELYTSNIERIYYEYNNTVYIFNEPYKLSIYEKR